LVGVDFHIDACRRQGFALVADLEIGDHLWRDLEIPP